MRKTAIIAVAALAAALAAGCATARDPGGAAQAASLDGTWVMRDGAMISFDGGNWTEYFPGGEPYLMGTFTAEGGIIFMTVTQVSGSFMSLMLGIDAEPRWHSLDEMRDIFVEIMAEYGFPEEAAVAHFDVEFGPFSTTYSVSGDDLALGGEVLSRL